MKGRYHILNNDNNLKYNTGTFKRQNRCTGCMPESNSHAEQERTPQVNNTIQERNGYGLVGFPLASVYSPIQNFTELYNCETGFTRGTIFTELDLPFICGGMSGGVNRG